MKLKNNNKGFSLAELLTVVLILVILMGVVFVGVQSHQRSMTRLEFDGIAKEIFVAAQNHLTSAEGQGYLQLNKYGTKSESYGTDKDDGVYIASKDVNDAKDILELMLPFGAVDETVRAGGTYIIRYQPSSGTVLDVFYSLPGPGRSSMLTVAGVNLTAGDYETLMGGYTGDDKSKARESFSHDHKSGVIGWYGGADALPVGKRLDAPEVIIHNEEILWVEILNSNNNETSEGASLKLIVKGDVSGTQIAFDLIDNSNTRIKQLPPDEEGNKRYAVILDDITTSGMHFSDLKATLGNGSSQGFIPGENISVEAVAFNNTAKTNIAYSGKNTTNSLFADIESVKVGENTAGSALIENFRHFENLDKTISSFKEAESYKNSSGDAVTISTARQVSDLNWSGVISDTGANAPKDFLQRIHTLRSSFPNYVDPETVTVYIYNSEKAQATTTSNTLYPVNPACPLSYDGASHKIYNVKVDFAGSSGLFGTVNQNGSEIKNLELIDFDITGKTNADANAGALIGTALNTTITNVLAYHTDKTDYKTPTVSSTSGSAGGLIGSANNCTVSKSAASLVVKASADAGGLIGASTGGTVTACYSGGHTYSGAATGADPKYPSPHQSVYPVRYYDESNSPIYNVTGANAGGLIGTAGTTAVSNSYSTCSASGTTKAGGFVGTGGAITNCYCTGLVKGAEEGAFAASVNSVSGSYYFDIINERRKVDASGNLTSGYDYLQPIGSVTPDAATGLTDGVKAFDTDAGTYNTFVGGPTVWKDAIPYDAGGTETYGLKVIYKVEGKPHYNLQTVQQLGAAVESTDFVTTHYGDWPAPEEFIFN